MKQVIFEFDDLNWSEKEIEHIRKEVEELCAMHSGEIKFDEGKVSYWRSGEPYYNDPSCWPKYVVIWEDEVDDDC